MKLAAVLLLGIFLTSFNPKPVHYNYCGPSFTFVNDDNINIYMSVSNDLQAEGKNPLVHNSSYNTQTVFTDLDYYYADLVLPSPHAPGIFHVYDPNGNVVAGLETLSTTQRGYSLYFYTAICGNYTIEWLPK